MAAEIDFENDLEIVRRGYDPQKVQRLVASLAEELKTLAAENASLREQFAQLEQREAEPKSSQPDDVISVWSRETTDLLEVARQNVARVMEKATAEAAALVAIAENDAETIRAQAVADADAHRARAEADTQMSTAAAQAKVDQVAAQLHETEATLAELEINREAIRQQLRATHTQLEGLIAIVEPSSTAAQGNVSD